MLFSRHFQFKQSTNSMLAEFVVEKIGGNFNKCISALGLGITLYKTSSSVKLKLLFLSLWVWLETASQIWPSAELKLYDDRVGGQNICLFHTD